MIKVNLLAYQIVAFKPDILLHLGDVYYSGTHGEANDNFLAICRQILGSSIPLYTLCGNHDMYSGGDGYYWLIDQIGQQSSYFCLQNDDWQFLAMDTGHNDHDPVTVATNMTSLVNIPGWSEANWHLNKIQQAGNRRAAEGEWFPEQSSRSRNDSSVRERDVEAFATKQDREHVAQALFVINN